MAQADDDVVCISFKRLPEGGYVALGGDDKPVKAFSSYQEMEWDVIMSMRKVCGGHPSDNMPKFVGEHQPPLRDELPTQSVKEPPRPIPFRERALNLVSRAHR